MGLGRRRVGTRLELGPLQSRFLAFKKLNPMRAKIDIKACRCRRDQDQYLLPVNPQLSKLVAVRDRSRYRGCLLGARAPTLLRHRRGRRLADCTRGARAHPATVRHRGGTLGSSSRGQSARRVQVKTAVSPRLPEECQQVTSKSVRPAGRTKKRPQYSRTGAFLHEEPGSDLLWHGLQPHYHRRRAFSLPSSEWDRVVPARYCRQANRKTLCFDACRVRQCCTDR